MSFHRFLLFGLLLLLGAGCTTASWIVEEEPVTDPATEEILSETSFLDVIVTPTPQQPLLVLSPVVRRELSYQEHLVSRRYVQSYHPRYGYLTLGLAGMTAGLYLSNTSVVDADRLSNRERAMLNLASVGIGAASFLSMKPVGEPRYADEQRLLQQTGLHLVTDTLTVSAPDDVAARVTITRADSLIAEGREIALENDQLTVNLPEETGIRILDIADTAGVHVEVSYDGKHFSRHIPVDHFLQEYVEIMENNVPLRTDPAAISGNIIRHASSSGFFPYLSTINDRWFRILESSGPAYVERERSRLVWRAAESDLSGTVIAGAGKPVFGDLSIERDVPENRHSNPEGIAIVIVNGEYSTPVRSLPYAARTAELVSHYLTRTMGFYSDNVRVFENLTLDEWQAFMQESDSLMIGGRHISMDESDLFVYYYGHAFTDDGDRLYMLPVDYDPGARTERLVAFDDFSNILGDIRSRQTLLVMDTDWERSSVYGQSPAGQVRSRSQLLERTSENFTANSESRAIFWAAEPGQHASSYSDGGERSDYPYDIFTWYFFEALQNGASTTGAVEQHLERNIPFTSRRLHDRAQNPRFIGNSNMNLVR
ncbi:caspase family protein [Balneolales bacterium ANBcel1]|nr:caspase family protein [Balneolales bacterium ANBcel1]